MEERRVAEYLVVAGLPPSPRPLADFSCDGATLKPTHNLPPITDLAVINRSLGEVVPDGYTCIETTPSGLTANLNHGALRAPEMFLCVRRGRDKQPLVDVGVLHEGKERVMPDSQIVEFTHGGRSANINPSGQTTYMTYRRASENAACNELVVSDICVIMTNRGDQAPHSYCTIDRNLNKNTMVGSDIYVCYKKSMNRSTSLAYMAGLLDRYPRVHRPDFHLPPDLALFCLPMGATLESWPAQSARPNPVSSTFVLTVTAMEAGGGGVETIEKSVEKVYGAAVTFYEKFPHDRLTAEQRSSLKLDEHFGRHNLVHTNKCVCILSHWPFFDAFDRFLKYLHQLASSGPHTIPIERYIHHFLEEVPFPSARRPRILIQLDATERISLAQPEDSPITLSGAKFYQLVMTLRPEGCLTVLLFTLTEQKILLHSLRPDVLTAVAEAISMIIFPFHWQCPYVPLCPLGLADILNAPIPFLLGLDTRFFDLYDPPSDVICVDLDTGAISVPEDKKYLVSKMLPHRAARTLRTTLETLCEKIQNFEKMRLNHIRTRKAQPDTSIDSEFTIKRREQKLDVEIQEAFLRFTASILRGYSAFLLPIVSAQAGQACDTSSLFDLQAFVKSRDRKYHKFYNLLVNTQTFSKFIEERSFVSDKDASLAFFDECAEKIVEDDPTIKLLEVEAAQSEHTLFLPPPDPSHLPEGQTYTYNGFPKLRPELFPPQDVLLALPPQVRAPQVTPASPLARRTKQEVKTDQRLASRYSQTPILWAKCLLSTCYSLWFTQLPAFASTQHHKGRFLQLAFKILINMQKLHLSQADEVSYRVMMQLCGLYSKPILAVKVLCEMRQHGITPNAITYGYYNRAVMENKWTHSNLFWNKLRNVVMGVAAFRQCGRERAQLRAASSLSLDVVDKCLTDADSSSRVSLESGASLDSSHPVAPHAKTDTLSSDPGYCSVSETSEIVSPPGAPPPAHQHHPPPPVSNSAGLLMSSVLDSSVLYGATRRRHTPSDLAHALSPTLHQYDKMSEATAVRTPPSPTPTTPQDKQVPEYLRSDSYGSDAKIITNLLRLARVDIEPIAQVGQLHGTPHGSSSSRNDPQQDPSDPRQDRQDSRDTQDPLTRSSDSLSDISEEGTPRGGRVQGFFSRNTPERLSSLFRRSVDSADGKLRGLWRRGGSVGSAGGSSKDGSGSGSREGSASLSRGGSVSRSSSKDSVNLEAGVAEYLEGPPYHAVSSSPTASSPTSSSADKTPEPLDVTLGLVVDESEDNEGKKEKEPPKIRLPPPRSPNINIRQDASYSPNPSSPRRTPVTENDPLGAFNIPLGPEGEGPGRGQPSSQLSLEPSLDTNMDYTSDPLRISGPPQSGPSLLDGGDRGGRRASRRVARSATFTGRSGQEPHGHLPVQRSANSLWALTPPSGHQLPTSRPDSPDTGEDNPASTDLVVASTSSWPTLKLSFSPVNFNSRKNELISGGLSSMKSAVTSLSKKYNEIREAISATNTPVRGVHGMRGEGDGDEDSLDGLFWSRRESADIPGVLPLDDTLPPLPLHQAAFLSAGLTLGGESDPMGGQHHDLFPALGWDAGGPFCLGVWLTSCNRCHNCAALLYDEEIMAGWRPDDSNLNTKCTFCEKVTVPLLTITIYDVRHNPRPEHTTPRHDPNKTTPAGSNPDTPDRGLAGEEPGRDEGRVEAGMKDNIGTQLQKKGVQLEAITVPYLSPLVLRKELETVLGHEGDSCLTKPAFTDHHPILYWNLLWYFSRLRVPSHLPGLCLSAGCVSSRDRRPDPSWHDADWHNVYVRCLWDNTKYHDELGVPMYLQWQQQDPPASPLVSALVRERSKVPRDVMQSVMTAIHIDDLGTALKLLLQELRKRPAALRRTHFPVYRDLLFLASSCIPSPQLNLTSFDREYRRAYERCEGSQGKLLARSDGPPPIAAVFCRRYFNQLGL